MPTFEVDDQLAFHPKVMRAGNEAMGLWVRAGAWCAGYLTDGCVPRDIAGTLGGTSLWQRLITAGLVEPTLTGDYQLHDYLHWNRPASEIAADRARAAEKKRDQRAKRRADSKCPQGTGGGTSPGTGPGHDRGHMGGRPGGVPASHARAFSPAPAPAGSSPTEKVTLATPASDPPGQPTAAVGEQGAPSAPPDPMLVLEPTTPKRQRTGKQTRMKLPGERKPDVSVGWQLWRTLYESSRRAYGRYVSNPDCGSAMVQIVTRARAEAVDEHGRVGGDAAELEARCLDHWFKAYLRDDGQGGFLAERRHALRFMLKSLSEYGTPWSKTVDSANARAEYEKTRAGLFKPGGGNNG